MADRGLYDDHIPVWEDSMPWRDEAACKGMDTFIFFGVQGGSVAMAKNVCFGSVQHGLEGCPVRLECLAYAIRAKEPYGVWGGRSEEERRAIVRERNKGKGTQARGG